MGDNFKRRQGCPPTIILIEKSSDINLEHLYMEQAKPQKYNKLKLNVAHIQNFISPKSKMLNLVLSNFNSNRFVHHNNQFINKLNV